MFFLINLTLLISIFSKIDFITLFGNKYLFVIFYFPFILPIIIRYWNGEKFDSLQNEFYRWTPNKKIIYNLLYYLWILFITIGTIFFAVYIGESGL